MPGVEAPSLACIRPLASTATIWNRRSLRDGGGRDSLKKVATNKSHPYAKLEREFITSQVSLRELCRRHGISAHSLVVVQAKKLKWAEKRRTYQAKASESFIEKHADRFADRQAEIRDNALDAIDEAITRFRSDLKATKPVRQPDGTMREEPAFLLTPRDLCHLIDRFQVLFARPATISQHQGVTISSEIPVETLQQLIDLTRGRIEPAPHVSPLPRAPRRLDD